MVHKYTYAYKLFTPRKFDGEIFERIDRYTNESRAKEDAEKYRDDGHKARVVRNKIPKSHSYQYILYVRRRK